MTRHRILTPLILTAAAAALVYSLVHQSQPQPPPLQTSAHPPQYVLRDVQLTRYGSDGQPQLQAHAAELNQYPDGYTTGSGLKVKTLNGNTTWTASAPHGEASQPDAPLHLTGGVQARSRWPDSNQTLTLHTPELWIDAHNHSLYTPARVRLDSPHRHGTAVGLRSNWLTRNLALLNQVQLEYDTP